MGRWGGNIPRSRSGRRSLIAQRQPLADRTDTPLELILLDRTHTPLSSLFEQYSSSLPFYAVKAVSRSKSRRIPACMISIVSLNKSVLSADN